MKFAGLVLVGGRSTRMGVDKAALPAPDGRNGTLLDHQISALTAAGANPVLLAGRIGQANQRPDLTWLNDVADAQGPLAGLLAGLQACPHPWLAVLAVDMPRFPPALWETWASNASPGCGWVTRGTKGHEPLAALYPREAFNVLRNASHLGNRLQDHLENLINKGFMRVWEQPVGADWLANWNYPSDIP